MQQINMGPGGMPMMYGRFPPQGMPPQGGMPPGGMPPPTGMMQHHPMGFSGPMGPGGMPIGARKISLKDRVAKTLMAKDKYINDASMGGDGEKFVKRQLTDAVRGTLEEVIKVPSQ
eukprot:TRINITY_DN27276_c0_g2_i1.p1 TRINITY_DN27276_c0_g2~~TRINITY_DN27276_c0_g2_i1.p1  ORF type:complete len:116 (-),score=7.96 TRINITY_DN27276_c0_g2_i1:36-383(-)